MHRSKHGGCPLRFDRKTTRLHDTERATEQRLRRRRAEAYDDLRFDERDLVLQPWKASAYLAGVWRLVQSPRAASIASPLEMLHRVRDVHIFARDTRGVEGPVEQLS